MQQLPNWLSLEDFLSILLCAMWSLSFQAPKNSVCCLKMLTEINKQFEAANHIEKLKNFYVF